MMEPSGSPLTGAAAQNLRWQTLILHIKEAPNGFKLYSVEDRGTFLVKVRSYPSFAILTIVT